jgi:hypothetical protein
MLFKEINDVYTENHTEPINKKCIVNWLLKAAATYSYHSALKVNSANKL